MKKPTNEFGNGSFVGDFLHPTNNSLELAPRDLARKLGFVAGCPVVERLTDPANVQAGRGTEAMIDRYGEVSFWFGQLSSQLSEQNYALSLQLRLPIVRQASDKETITAFDEESIPNDYFDFMQPLGTIYGYALPRVLIEQMRGAGDDSQTTEAVQDRLIKGMEAFDEITNDDCSDLYELTARFAEAAVLLDADPNKVLSHVLAPGWLEEHGATWMFTKMKKALEKNAPILWSSYADE